jgi:hypothetical protein
MKLNKNTHRPANAVSALIIACLTASANAAITYQKITNDATSGISTSTTYTHKIDFGTSNVAGGGATVNSVTFDQSTISGFNATYGGAFPSTNAGTANSATIGGGVGGLFQGFLLRGATSTNNATNTLTLTGLTEGTQYDFRIYSGQWRVSSTRNNTITFDPDGAGAISDSTPLINQDDPTALGFSGTDAYYISYTYTATASGELVVDFTTGPGPTLQGSWHIYAITNQVVPDVSPYGIWAATYSPANLSNKAGDNDNDGLKNLQEFAFGTNPTVSDSAYISYVPGGAVTSAGKPEAVNVVASGVDFRAVFGRRKDWEAVGLTYTVQFSVTMEEGTWVDSSATPTLLTGDNVANPGDIEAVSVPYPLFIPVTGGYAKPTFFRVGVTLD